MSTRHLGSKRGWIIAAALMGGVAPGVTLGDLKTWDGGAGTGNWGDGNNWNLDGVPAANDDVTIINPGVPINIGGTRDHNARTVTLTDATFTSDAIDFSSSQGTFIATNATFNAGVTLLRLPINITFTNSFYTDTGTSWFIGAAAVNSNMTITGGQIRMGNLEIRSSVSPAAVTTVTIDGASAVHFINNLRIGGNGADIGKGIFNVKNISIANAVNTGTQTWAATGDNSLAEINLENSAMRIEGNLTINNNATLKVVNSNLRIDSGFLRNYVNRQDNAAKFDGEGLTFTTLANGDRVKYEVSGTDIGADFAGFHDNYSIDSLGLVYNSGPTSAHLELTDLNDNNGGGADAQALYVDRITLDASSKPSFDINTAAAGRRIYYKQLVLNGKTLTVDGAAYTGSANFVQVTGADLMSKTPFVHTPDVQTLVDQSNTMVSVNSEYGTIILTGSNPGAAVEILLDVDDNAGDVPGLISFLGASTEVAGRVPEGLEGTDWDMLLTYNGVADGNPLFFDWSFSAYGVTLNNITTAVPEPASAAMLSLMTLAALRRRRS